MLNYIDNPTLPYVDLPFDWKGTPITSKGRFVNHQHRYNTSFKDVLRWQLSKNPQKVEKKNDKWRLQVMHSENFLSNNENCIVWLGHASFFIRINGITFLIDPVLFNVSIVKRQSEFPLKPSSIKNIDYILISHNHRDHCDSKSLKIIAKNNPDAKVLSSLKMENTLKKMTGLNHIQSAGWYQQYLTHDELKITFVPSRHWSRRYIRDTNCSLWGGFVIEVGDTTIYFSGDSGYGNHFKYIQKLFQNIDYFMVGIGAYKPDYIMSSSHLSPIEAVTAFHDSGARKMIPMHYGTFDLSDEPLGEPLRLLKSIDSNQGINGDVRYLVPGQIEFID